MRKTMAKEVVHSVLDYFSLYMTFARLRNDLRTVEHFEDCWRLVFIQFFGSYRVPTPSPMVSCQGSADTAPRPRPRWFTEKYSRPVRKVVGRTTERVAGLGRGEYFSVAFDVLECGHKKESTSALTGAPPAKHRRCNFCEVAPILPANAESRLEKTTVAYSVLTEGAVLHSACNTERRGNPGAGCRPLQIGV